MGRATVNEMRCDLQYVKAYRDRHGRMRYYLRKKGSKAIALSGEPGSTEFISCYNAALNATKPVEIGRGIEPGSFEALCREYIASADFADLAESTRREITYVLNALRSQHGAKPIAQLERRHIVGWKDALRAKPGAANKMLRTLKVLLGYAVLKDYRTDNPADGIKLMKLGRFRSWTDAELRAFQAKWPIGTLERTIFDLALYTGQRRSDLASFRRDQIQSGHLTFTQHKTSREMTIRVHANLARSLAAFLPTHSAQTIIAGESGRPLGPIYMAAVLRGAIKAAGLPDDCVLHGLRKTVARILAEIGNKSAPVTGHATRAMQDEYERDASQKKMASDAIQAWEKSAKVSNRRKRSV